MTETTRGFRRARTEQLSFDPRPGEQRDLERTQTPPLRAPQLGQKRSVSKTVIELYQLQEGRCFHCRKAMLPTATRLKANGRYDRGWTREHVVPQVSGGRNGRNIVLSCRGCNAQKGHRMPTERELEIATALHDGVPLRRFPPEPSPA